ncbi:eukaryotic translation initiation factor 3 subunit J [Talaromyces proteolyticus]|uniref:Eukaryotic translation initiation factor 3 subunit J n=1 Tax=Talaromyces proteolyticus TaxID=1131652 RepID=A0AAD4KMB4_9EURO|nr:eukaryotic translation initiation factor 3 subunit J [Talaromyces proteolyticus]KAH8693605.1 eukaryotic translation initiation factor 3 subunit J [Talaromyces proteolyticus]
MVITQTNPIDHKQILDSWDAAEDSEVEREKAAVAAAAKAKAEAEAAAKKKSKGQRIQEHQSERRRLAEESDSDSSEDEDEAERRARIRKTEQDSDLKHAEDLFGDVDLNRNRGKPKAVVVGDAADPTKSVDLSAMPLFKPTTKDQFAALTNVLIPLLTANSKKVQYGLWAPEFAKQLVKDLPSDQVKKVASALTAFSNEKMREERVADKGAKKSKAAKTKTSLNAQRDFAKADTNTYEEDFGEDDFM